MAEGHAVARNRDVISERRISLLYTLWDSLLEGEGSRSAEFNRSNVPEAPHMENCQFNLQIYRKLDERGENGSLPPWRNWRALLGFEQRQIKKGEGQEGAYPPWVRHFISVNFFKKFSVLVSKCQISRRLFFWKLTFVFVYAALV